MTEIKTYNKLAKYYDKIYSEKDYAAEVKFIEWVVIQHKKSKGKKLLDVACGTGNHIQYLKSQFTITGFDLNSEMLKLARKKFPGLKFLKGDMKKFALKDKFDVILCMFAAIAYNLTYSELESTLTKFYDHLLPGGLILFDLHIHDDHFLSDRVWINTVVEKDLQLARISPSPERKPILDLNMVFLIKEKGNVDFEIDSHQIGLFNVEKIKKIMTKVGFKTKIYAGFKEKELRKKQKSPAVFVGIK